MKTPILFSLTIAMKLLELPTFLKIKSNQLLVRILPFALIAVLIDGCCTNKPDSSKPVSAQTPDPFHETAAEYNARAQWFRDAKLGIFVHWNPSSLVGKEISWSRDGVGREKYDQLYKQFKGENFNADEWIKIFHDAGARYAIFVPKHHDGFCMFDTKTSDYNVMHSPFGRDYIKEMSKACAKSDVRFCLYYSILDWWNPAYSGKAGADLTEYEKVMKTHLTELLTHYGPVGCLWFDGDWEGSWTHERGRDLYAFVRGLQPATLIGKRVEPSSDHAPDAVGDYEEREMDIGNFSMGKVWDSCLDLNSAGWAWVPPVKLRPLPELLNWLVQCIGRDGNMLLGVGPRPDGTIDPDSIARLHELGGWLKTHGKAVYGTRGGPYLPGDWGVSTRKGNKVFVFMTHWNGGTLKLPALSANVKSARILGEEAGETLSFTPTDSLWTLRAPRATSDAQILVVELTLDHDVTDLPMVMNRPTVDVSDIPSLSKGKPVEVSSVWPGREDELNKSHITDGKLDTLWAAEESARSAWVTVDLQTTQEVSAAMLSDAPYGRTQSFDLEAQVNGDWKKIAEGTTIGDRLNLSFPPVKAQLFRLNIRKASDTPTLAEFQLFAK
jgi:alpha-L-fucosidase